MNRTVILAGAIALAALVVLALTGDPRAVLAIVGAGVLFNQGETIMLEAFVNKTAGQNLRLKLFTNNVTPAEGDTEATYTEASGFGYADVLLSGASWTVAAGAPSDASFAQQIFTFTGALGNVYGYYYTQTTSGKAVGAERFTDGPYNIQNNGDQIKITPKITQD